MSTDPRQRILDATARLLAESGSDALSTRAVAAAAKVQAPTLYRIFGDKQGLIEAVTAYGFERYLAGKHALTPTGDLVEDLRRGWDLHVEFALTYPDFYALMYGSVRPGHRPAAAREATEILQTMLQRVAHAGRLRVPVATSAQMVHAASVGVALTLIASPENERDPALSTRVREVVLGALVTGVAPEHGEAADPLAARALALDAALADAAPSTATRQTSTPPTATRSSAALTDAETALLRQWLRRLAEDGGPAGSSTGEATGQGAGVSPR